MLHNEVAVRCISRAKRVPVEVHSPMDDVHDLYVRLSGAVENQVLADWEAAITGAQFITFASGLGEVCQELEVMGEQIDKPISSRFVVSSNVKPDLEDVAARRLA